MRWVEQREYPSAQILEVDWEDMEWTARWARRLERKEESSSGNGETLVPGLVRVTYKILPRDRTSGHAFCIFAGIWV